MQSLEVTQITCITFIDLIYFISVRKDIFGKETFESFGIKLKYIFQEVAILTFLVVLTVFAIFGSNEFRETGFFAFLELVVVIGVIVAIGAEAIATVWGIVGSIREFLQEMAKKKLASKMSDAEKLAKVASEEEGVMPRSITMGNDKIRKFVTRKVDRIQGFGEVGPNGNELQTPELSEQIEFASSKQRPFHVLGEESPLNECQSSDFKPGSLQEGVSISAKATHILGLHLRGLSIRKNTESETVDKDSKQ